MTSLSESNDGCRRHINQKDCGKCKEQTKSWSYPDWYSNWECRKERCKPKPCEGKSFKYNGVYLTDKCCPPVTDWVELLREPPTDAPIVIVRQPVGATYCVGQTATPLSVLVQGDGPFEYQWYLSEEDTPGSGNPLQDETGEQYTPPTDVESTFYYYVTITNTLGDQVTSSIVAVVTNVCV